MLEPLLEKLEKNIIDINQLDNDTRKMIENYKKNKEEFAQYEKEHYDADLDLIEEEEEEEEDSIEIPEEHYDSKNKNISFLYYESKIVISWNFTIEIKFENQILDYNQVNKILEIISPEFDYIVQFYIDKYNIYQKVDSNLKIKQDLEEIKNNISTIKMKEEKYPKFNEFFNVPEEDRVKVIDKRQNNKITELFNKIDSLANQNKSIKSKPLRSRTKTKNKK